MRSKIIGDIVPIKKVKSITAKDIQMLKKLAEELNLPKRTYKQRERTYRKHLLEKYGKGI